MGGASNLLSDEFLVQQKLLKEVARTTVLKLKKET
jgi:hypothetical protein